jgi:hypothetical protein
MADLTPHGPLRQPMWWQGKAYHTSGKTGTPNGKAPVAAWGPVPCLPCGTTSLQSSGDLVCRSGSPSIMREPSHGSESGHS